MAKRGRPPKVRTETPPLQADDLADQNDHIAGLLALPRAPLELTLLPSSAYMLALVVQWGRQHPATSAPVDAVAAGFLALVDEYFAESSTVLKALERGAGPAGK